MGLAVLWVELKELLCLSHRPRAFSLLLLLHSNRLLIPKDRELNEDNHIFNHRAQRTNKPRQIRQEVVDLDRMEQDSSSVCEISEQAQQEEQQTQAFTRPLTLVLDDLRYPRTKIAYGADVAQNFGSNRLAIAVFVTSGYWLPCACLPGDSPASSANDSDASDAQSILDPLVVQIFLCLQAWQGTCASAPAESAASATDARNVSTDTRVLILASRMALMTETTRLVSSAASTS